MNVTDDRHGRRPSAMKLALAPLDRTTLVRLEVDLPADTIAELRAAAGDPEAVGAVDLPEGEIPWTAVGMMTDTDSGDGRHFLADGGSHRDLPLPFMANMETTWEHEGAFIAGRVESITLGSPEVLMAGVYDDSDQAREACRQAVVGNITGVSADLTDCSWEVFWFDDDGNEVEFDEVPEQDWDTLDPRQTFDLWRVAGLTQTPFPAFEQCQLAVDGLTEIPETAPAEDPAPDAEPEAEEEPVEEDGASVAPLVAAGPLAPDPRWFDEPPMTEPEAPTYLDTGQAYGLLATFDTCHLAFAEACVCAPRSLSDYRHAHLGTVVCADGSEVSTGRITLGGGHAAVNLDPSATVAHYEDAGSVVADVRFGENEFGVWFAGAVRSTVTDEQLRALRAAPLSGDWRRIDGNLELVACLCVNSPGFPVPRARVASGHVQSLVASAGVSPLAQQVQDREHPASIADVAEVRELVEAQSALVASLAGKLEALDPLVREGLALRMTVLGDEAVETVAEELRNGRIRVR